MVKTEVAKVCAESLERGIGAGDPAVWLIRRLDLDLSLAVNRVSPESVANDWGVQLAGSIHRAFERGEENELVLRFPNRAAYLAQFVRDLSAGRAWNRWYYQQFESLRSLPISRAITELFAGEPEQTGPALVSLMAIQALRDVLCTLTSHDSRRVFQLWRNSTASMDDRAGESAWVGRLLQYWSETPFRNGGRAISDDSGFRDGLWWATLAVERHPGSEVDSGLLAAVDSLLELRGVLAALSPVQRARVMRHLASGEIEDAIALALQEGVDGRPPALEFFARNMQGDLNWAKEAEGVLLGEREYLSRSASPQVITHGPAIPSAFAGVFRLGPSFLASGCDQILGACDPDTSALLRHVLAMKCMGGERASAGENDAGMRVFSGFGGRSAAGALQALNPHRMNLRSAQAALVNILRNSGRCQYVCWLVETVSLPHSGHQAILVRDVMEDEWIFGSLMPSDAARARTVDDAIERAFELTGAESPVLLWRSGDPGELQPGTRHRWISLDQGAGIEATLAEQFHVPLSRFVRALRAPVDDLAYLSLHDVVPPTHPELDLSWTLVARAILKHFARRLIGFEMSSAQYLYSNFLAGTGFIRDSGERIEAELTCSELSIVLRLSGLLQETYVLPWIQGREICLLPPVE